MAKAQRSRRTKIEPPPVFQFLVVLPGTDPLVWRRLQVPSTYSFWDLHVAIQDAMGWLDYHLHEFEFVDPKTRRMLRIGIPDDEAPRERPCLTGWRVRVSDHVWYHSGPITYRYDFGDDWAHVLAFEEAVDADGGRYPRCVDGAGACPPEDVGGTHRYAEFLEAMRDPTHPEHEEFATWIGGSFDPHAFDPKAVVFADPKQRWKLAFEGD